MCTLLCGADGASLAGAGTIFPFAADWVLRGDRGRAWDCLAGGGFAGAAPISWTETERGAAGSLDDLAYAAADRGGDASSGVPLGAGVTGGEGIAAGQDGGHRRNDVGSERGYAFDRTTRYGRRLRRVSAAAGRGIGDRDVHAGAVGEAGSQAREKGIE